MDLKISGKRALVTGAGGEIGLETARLLHEAGVALILSDIDDTVLGTAADRVGCEVHTVTADLSTLAGVESFADEIDTHGGVDILVHAAGVTGAKGDPLTMEDEAWMHAWNIDFMSAVRLSRRLVPAMVDTGWGRVVFVTSENAVQPYADEAVYNASKAALLNYCKCVSMPYAPKGVLFNTVAPAFIETDMTDGMMKQRADELDVSFDEAVQSFLKEERPFLTVGRRGQPEEVASVIAFLCSARASFVTGSAYRVDGGAVAAMNT